MAENSLASSSGYLQFPHKSAAHLADALAHRILMGQYADGEALPSCREVARDLQMDKNTVNKAYRLLEERGLVRTVSGKGVFVIRQRELPSQLDGLQESIDAVIWQAKALGVREDALWKLLTQAIWRFYAAARVKLLLIECNEYEAQRMSQQIEDRLSQPVEWVLLPDFLARPRAYLRSADLIVTTFHHLATVSDAAGSQQHRVLGLQAIPVPDNVIAIARAKKGSRVGVTCTTEAVMGALIGLVYSNNSSVEVFSHMMTDAKALARFMSSMDLIVDTMSTHQAILALKPTVPVVTVAYMIEEQSIEFLRNKLMAITRERVERSA